MNLKKEKKSATWRFGNHYLHLWTTGTPKGVMLSPEFVSNVRGIIHPFFRKKGAELPSCLSYFWTSRFIYHQYHGVSVYLGKK
jgi:long-subunit acyl-CoA synthetase (AMP-forming)